jgi:hypothetical protein
MILRWRELFCALVSMFVVLTASVDFARAEPCFNSVEDLGRWFTGYYKNPEPAKLVCSLEFLGESGGTLLNERVWSTMSFYAAVLEGSDVVRDAFMRELSRSNSSEARTLAVVGFFLMNPSVGRPLLEQSAGEWAGSWEGQVAAILGESVPENFLSRSIVSGADAIRAANVLDSCWLAFLGSGDPSRIQPVIEAAHWALLEKSARQVVGKTAVWSLASNARAHPRVRLYLAAQLPAADEATSMILSKILAEMPGAKEERGMEMELSWKEGKGGLRAALIVTDKPDAFFEAWGHGGKNIPMGSCVEAKKGQPVVAAVVISRCSVNPTGHCNVVGDYALKAPSGKDYAESKQVHLWVDKMPPPEKGVVLSTGYMGFVFEPEDPLGNYRASVKVRDTVSGDVLQLSHTMKLAR